MEPGFKAGDHIVTFNWGKYRAGDVVVFESDGKNYLKRINKILGEVIKASGDNFWHSPKVYEVRKKKILGKVFLKY